VLLFSPSCVYIYTVYIYAARKEDGQNRQAEQDSQNLTGRTGQAGLDKQNCTGRIGQAEQERQN
jgi:hypothetical protein